MVDLVGSIVLIVVGIILVFVARQVTIEPIVNKILYIVGMILILVGILFLILSLIGVVV